jgi:DNA-binding GntR family transcriptional regulator
MAKSAKSPSAPQVRQGRRHARGKGLEAAYQEVRRRILTLSLPPGVDLDEKTIAQELGISRTPLREALLRLSGEHLVTIRPNCGAQVTPISVTDFPHYIDSLALVQRAVNYLAARQRTDDHIQYIDIACNTFEQASQDNDVLAMADANRDFHAQIGFASGNPFLIQTYEYLLDYGIRLAHISFSYGDGAELDQDGIAHRNKVINEHRAMVRAIRLGDAATCDRLGHEHAELFQRRFLQQMQQDNISHIHVSSSATS